MFRNFNMVTKLEAQWIVGFVDSEGCFHIGINKNKSMKLGYQVLPEFTIVQHKRDIQILYALKHYFRTGVVRKNNENIMSYRVRNQKTLRQVIVPFFEKHPLKTKKRLDFISFRKVILMMEHNEHLLESGLQKIREIRAK